MGAPVSNTHVSPYIGYGEQQNSHFPASFIGEAIGNPLPGYHSSISHSGQFYPQTVGMSAGNAHSASPSRYRVSQAFPGMSPYENLAPYISPNQISHLPSSKKQKLDEYGAAYSTQPVTPPRRVTRGGAKVDYTECSPSPLSEPPLSSPATSMEQSPKSSKVKGQFEFTVSSPFSEEATFSFFPMSCLRSSQLTVTRIIMENSSLCHMIPGTTASNRHLLSCLQQSSSSKTHEREVRHSKRTLNLK